MIARASKLFLPTLREDPADAEAVSHKLLVRGGFVRQLATGLWSFTPLGWRVQRKIEQIVREELDAFGAQEWLAPVLTPVELWEATGRAGIPELFRLQDRAGRRYILPLTHEATFAFHARELQSYKQLPQVWYHFQTKDRDEPRPPTFPERLDAPQEVETPGATTIEDLARFLDIDPAATSKAMPVVKADGSLVLGLLRGDDRLEEMKMLTALGSDFRPATEDEIRAAFGADPGSLGPIGFDGEVVADDALREGQFVAGANRTGWHHRGGEAGRDYQPRLADMPQEEEGGSGP